jgi:RHS repeat-associated protein
MVQVYTYGAYGEPSSWSSAGSRYRYTGQIMLPEAAVFHYKARVYDPALGRFLQTDPVGYKSDVNLYAYVNGDPVDHQDPTGLTCSGKGENTSCQIDRVVTPKDRPLTKQESAQISAFNKAYTAAVKTLQSDPGKTVGVTVGGKTFDAKAGDIAKSLAGRTFVAEVGAPGTAGTAANGTTYVFSQGLAGTVGPQSERGQTDREITTVHEGIHRGPGERQAFPNPQDPATNQPSHGLPYDNASRQLLGVPEYDPNQQ